MIGNAVPVRMGKVLAQKIYSDLEEIKIVKKTIKESVSTEVNGNVVLEKMNEIIKSISA
jgi:DNA (cytosine-5)-methyltransferase 1